MKKTQCAFNVARISAFPYNPIHHYEEREGVGDFLDKSLRAALLMLSVLGNTFVALIRHYCNVFH